MLVDVSAWNPCASCQTCDSDLIAVISIVPSPLWASTTFAVVLRGVRVDGAAGLMVQTRVVTPDTVPAPGSVASASWFSRSIPVRVRAADRDERRLVRTGRDLTAGDLGP